MVNIIKKQNNGKIHGENKGGKKFSKKEHIKEDFQQKIFIQNILKKLIKD